MAVGVHSGHARIFSLFQQSLCCKRKEEVWVVNDKSGKT